MWYGTFRYRKFCTVLLGTGNVVRYFWGQEMWYSTDGDRKCGTVFLWKGNVLQ
jgi:hypothetical protein